MLHPTKLITFLYTTALLCSAGTLAACTSDDPAPTAQVAGEMRYRDAATNSDGTPHEAEAPPAQDAHITVEVRGTGTLTGLDGTCALEAASGQFRALFAADAAVGDGGAYVTALAAGDARIETLGGCPVPELTVALITDVVVRGELVTTTASCDSYCAASARGDAEAACAGDASQATCRAAAQASAEAACRTECTTQRDLIVAEASVAAGLLGDLDAETLRAAAFGDVSVDLTFDHME